MAVVWRPSRDHISNSNLKKFTDFVVKNTCKDIKSYDELHHFSISNPEFWRFIIAVSYTHLTLPTKRIV